MGNDLKWPCTENRKESTFSPPRGTKYEGIIATESDATQRQSMSPYNRKSPQNMLNRRGLMSPKYTRGHSVLSGDVVSDSGYDGQSVGSVAERGPRIVITSQKIVNFKTFMDDVAKTYDTVMVPTHITMHPILPQPLFVLQAQEMTSLFKIGKGNNIKYKHFSKRFEPVSRSALYQDLTSYIRSQCEAGLDYIGYYIAEESATSTKYNFVFVEKAQPPGKTYSVQFETLETIDEKIASQILMERLQDGFKFKGMIRWSPPIDYSLSDRNNQNKSFLMSGINIMIFEKDPHLYLNHHVVEFNGKDVNPVELESKISLNIDRTCETNGFEFSGIISAAEGQSIILVLSEE